MKRMHIPHPLLWGVLLFVLTLTAAPRVEAALFQGDAKDYVVYVRGYLWLFSRTANTSVTVTNLATGGPVSVS